MIHSAMARPIPRERLKAWPVLRQQAIVEVRGDAVQAEGGGVALVAAHHQAAGIATEVHEAVGVAHGRQVFRNRLGDAGEQVLMRHRDDGKRDAGHVRDLGCVHPAGVDHHLGFDVTALGLDAADPAAIGFDRSDPHTLADARAATSRPFGQRQREPTRVEVAVGWNKGGADHMVPCHQRKAPLRLVRADELQRETEARPPTSLAFKLFHSLGRRG
jgi:hypothetical protein